MCVTKKASARYESFGKNGKGYVSTETGALSQTPYGFTSRFAETTKGTNPEELIAAAHSACFTMALSMALEKAGYADGLIETQCKVKLGKKDDGFFISSSALSLQASIERIAPEQFEELANDAKQNCPVSKLLNTDITLDISLNQ